MADNGQVYDLYDLGAYLAAQDDYVTTYEPVYGDRDFDYGYADDGWPRPGPCPVCGAPDWTCVTDYYAEQARLRYIAEHADITG